MSEVSKSFKAFFFWERRRALHSLGDRRRLAGLLPGDGRIRSPARRRRSQRWKMVTVSKRI
jgi:hypothetical protein